MITRFDTLVHVAKRLQAAERRSLQAAARRSALSPGGTRASVTTANANWARAAEQRDRVLEQLEQEIERLRLGSLDAQNLRAQLYAAEQELADLRAEKASDEGAPF